MEANVICNEGWIMDIDKGKSLHTDLLITPGDGYIDEVWEIPAKADTHYYTHGMYRYIGKFPPQIPREILSRYAQPGMTVLDPMCGGGTTLIESVTAGCNAIGMDVNPVSLMVSSVVATRYDIDRLRPLCAEIKNSIPTWDEDSLLFCPKALPKAKKLSLGNSEKYFSEAALKQCSLLMGWIDQVSEKEYQDFFHVALLAILRKVSYANVKKINVTIDQTKTVRDVYPTFVKQLDMMLQSEVNTSNAWTDASLTVVQGDARSLFLDGGSADIVIIHPPYLSNTAFSESTQLQLAFLGIDHRSIWKKELKMRGSYLHEPDGLRKYLVGWNKILKEAHRVLRPGGICAIENGDGYTDFVRIPIGVITREFARDIGFVIEKHILHKINNNTGRTLSHNMKEQHIIIMRK